MSRLVTSAPATSPVSVSRMADSRMVRISLAPRVNRWIYYTAGVKRRDILKTAGAVTMAGWGAGCAARSKPIASAPRSPQRPLAPVNCSRERVIRTVAGLRPFRPSGFLVRTDTIERKTIIHNYGHGGAGITLSWGTAQLALEEAVRSGHTEFAVLGCGVIGLSTARLVQRRGVTVTI